MSGGLKIRFTLLVTLVAASLGLATGVAAAWEPSSNTSIKIEGTRGATVQNLQVFGKVSSPSRECVAGRRVKIFRSARTAAGSSTPTGPGAEGPSAAAETSAARWTEYA